MNMNDKYAKQMWSFVGKATGQLEDLVDDVNHADSTFSEVVKYYGEDEKNMNSAEFYGIFKTFVTSYRVCTVKLYLVLLHLPSFAFLQKCRSDNLTIAEERHAVEKRRQAAEDARKAKQQDVPQQNEEDTAVLDNLLAMLGKGDIVGRKARRTKSRAVSRTASGNGPSPLTLNTDVLLTKSGDETVNIARDMLMRLKSDGFDALTPSTPTASSMNMRRSRRKRDSEGVAALAALGESISPGGLEREEESDTPVGTQPVIALDSIEEQPSPSS